MTLLCSIAPALALSVGRDDIPAAIERLQAEGKSLAKERQKLREELATYHATRLAVEEMIQDNLRLVRRIFTDRDREYVRLLASRADRDRSPDHRALHLRRNRPAQESFSPAARI